MYEDRPCVVSGFSPMGVEPRTVWLRDVVTNELAQAPLDDAASAFNAGDGDVAA